MRNWRKSILRGMGFLLVLAILLSLAVPVFATEKNKKIRVGYYILNGYQEMDENNRFRGYGYDYYQALAQYTDWQYEYVLGSWSECLERLKNGEIDILGYVQKTEEREKYFDFADTPSGIAMTCLITKGDNHAYAYEDFSSFDGMSVGVVKGNINNMELVAYGKENGFSMNMIEFNSFADMYDCLDSKGIEAAFTTDNQKISGYNIIGKLSSNPFYFATTKGNKEVLSQLNKGMNCIYLYDINFNTNLYNKYFGTQKGVTAVFTLEELEYIKKNREVRVWYDADWFPLEYYDEKKGIYQGVIPDILELLSEQSGIHFVEEKGVKGKSVLEEVAKQKGNHITAITFDYDWADRNNLRTTQPFLSMAVVCLTKEEKNNPKTVALVEGSYIGTQVQKQFPWLNVHRYDTTSQCVEAVRKGKVDCTYLNSYETHYFLSFTKYHRLSFRVNLEFDQNVSLGVSKESDPLLFSILSKSMKSISHDDFKAIILENTSEVRAHTIEDFIYSNPMESIIIAVAIGGLFVGLLVLFYRNKVNQEKNLVLQKDSDRKSDFLSRMSHDIRTPMNAVIGMTELALGETDDPIAVERYLCKIKNSAEYLLTMVNDILEMSRIESGKMALYPEAVSMQEYYKTIDAILRPLAVEKGVDYSFSLDGIDQAYAYFDKMRVKQVFLNLISNAIQFTPKGGKVWCRVENRKKDKGTFYQRIVVGDTGIGMADEFQKKLFLPFEQENTTLDNSRTGTGLGLAIVKSVVELMNGTISVTSKKSVGTEFVVEVELAMVSERTGRQKERKEKNEFDFKGKRALLAEDHPLNTEIMKRLLQKKGLTVEHGENGQVVMEMFEQSSLGYYDCILMDICMPVMDGLEAARNIRQLSREAAKTVPIIAVTANAFDEDIVQSRAAGMDKHLAKPVKPLELYKTLEVAMNRSRPKRKHR